MRVVPVCFIPLFYLFYGCLLWMLSTLFEIGEVPLDTHKELFFGGFICTFIFSKLAESEKLKIIHYLIFSSPLFLIFSQSKIYWTLNFSLWIFFIFNQSKLGNRDQSYPLQNKFNYLFLFAGIFGSLEVLKLQQFVLLETMSVLYIIDKILEKPQNISRWQRRFQKLSIAFIFIGYTLIILFPDYTQNLKHFIFIGGLSLYVLTSLFPSKFKKSIIASALLIILATFTRTTAFMIPESYFRHFGYAAFLLIIVTLLCLRAIIKSLKAHNESIK